MNILVQGAGALGAYFGGRMLEAGVNVSFFVREKRAAQLEKEGLKLYSPEGNFERKDVMVFTSPEQVNNIDLVILAVKGYHLEQAIQQVQTIVQQTGVFVLPLLNGIEHLEKLQQAVGKEKVLGGFASIIATLDEHGHVKHTSGSGMIKFGALHLGQLEVCEKLEEINAQVKTNILREQEILKHMWNKYIFITAFSGITSATQLPVGFIASSEATFGVAKKVIFEMKNLAVKEGIAITDQEAERMAINLKKLHKDATSSMHQDMIKGLPLEVEHLQGGALRLAAKHDLAVPVIETLYGILKPYENGRPN
ncbi:ketopantoate reductase family protein [Bacillus sp. EB600]|uniref:ketopantoate reductase family protein n=1 Tax=Bacillus sp. EB600 TaxID=2806345 RepID=UPI00210A8F79|nr:2-dehydropantoate 2-reductase [Bacillus sp. EB600]MCQ6282310.1 2-dehydropantoate 2-reductase [Bacillus sp. EB600]